MAERDIDGGRAARRSAPVPPPPAPVPYVAPPASVVERKEAALAAPAPVPNLPPPDTLETQTVATRLIGAAARSGAAKAVAGYAGLEGAGFIAEHVPAGRSGAADAYRAGELAGGGLVDPRSMLTRADGSEPAERTEARDRIREALASVGEADGGPLGKLAAGAVAAGLGTVGFVKGLLAGPEEVARQGTVGALDFAIPSEVVTDKLAAMRAGLPELSSREESKRLAKVAREERAELRAAKAAMGGTVREPRSTGERDATEEQAHVTEDAPGSGSVGGELPRGDGAEDGVQAVPLHAPASSFPVLEPTAPSGAAQEPPPMETDLRQLAVQAGALRTPQTGPAIGTITTPSDYTVANVVPGQTPSADGILGRVQQAARRAGEAVAANPGKAAAVAGGLGVLGAAVGGDLARGEGSVIRRAGAAVKRKVSKRKASKKKATRSISSGRAKPKKQASATTKRAARSGGKKSKRRGHALSREDRSGVVSVRKTWRGKPVKFTANGQPYVMEMRRHPQTGKRVKMARFVPK